MPSNQTQFIYIYVCIIYQLFVLLIIYPLFKLSLTLKIKYAVVASILPLHRH